MSRPNRVNRVIDTQMSKTIFIAFITAKKMAACDRCQQRPTVLRFDLVRDRRSFVVSLDPRAPSLQDDLDSDSANFGDTRQSGASRRLNPSHNVVRLRRRQIDLERSRASPSMPAPSFAVTLDTETRNDS